MKPSAVTIVIGFIVFFSSLFILFPASEIVSVMKLKRDSVIAQGIVTTVQRESNTEMDGIGYGVKYAVGNRTYEVANRALSLDTLYRVGQHLEIIYDKNNPERSKINTFRELYGAWFYFIALGTGLIIITLFFKEKIHRLLA